MPLLAVSFSYLCIPLLLFAAGWLQPLIALLFVAILGIGIAPARHELATKVSVGWRRAAMAAVVALAWTALSGVGGLGFRNPDWPKHESVLKALVTESWPVVFEGRFPGLEGELHALVFYLGYYLPAGAVGKLFGWGAANAALAVWTALGAWLVLSAFARLVGSGGGVAGATLLFVFASGLDVVGSILRPGALFGLTEHLEWWTDRWAYLSNTSHLFWAPHHALGGWLASALVVEAVTRKGAERIAPLAVAAGLLWSPFVALGLLPLAAIAVVRAPRETLRLPGLLAASATGALLTLYYLALRQDRLPASFDRSIFGERCGLFVAFLAVEFAFVWLCARPARYDAPPVRALWLVSGAVLLTLPFFRLGKYNDLVMRASIPALFVLWWLAARVLFNGDRPRRLRIALAALLVVGVATPVTEMTRSLRAWKYAPRPLAGTRDLPLAHSDAEMARQYFGPPDALFFRWLAKPPRLRPSAGPR